MKIAYLSIVTLALLAVPETLAEEFDVPHVVAYGTATVEVSPNQMRWRLNVRNMDPTSMGAAKSHETTVAAVLDFLKQSKIAEGTIQTSRMQLGENWDYSRSERRRNGYYASTDVQFTLVDLARYASLWIGLSGIQGVLVNEVSLDHADRIQFQNDARIKAVLAARDKAKAMAETLDARIGDPLIVEEELEGYQSQAPSNLNSVQMQGDPGSVDISLAPGSIPIRARVKVLFHLQKK